MKFDVRFLDVASFPEVITGHSEDRRNSEWDGTCLSVPFVWKTFREKKRLISVNNRYESKYRNRGLGRVHDRVTSIYPLYVIVYPVTNFILKKFVLCRLNRLTKVVKSIACIYSYIIHLLFIYYCVVQIRCVLSESNFSELSDDRF